VRERIGIARARNVAGVVVVVVGLCLMSEAALAGPPRRSVVAVRAQPPTTQPPVALSAPATAWTCDKCHSPQSWKTIPKRVDFDHDRTGVPLTGAHAMAPCAGCHKAHAAPGPEKRRVPRACKSCHTDVHRGEQGARCDSCHTSKSWKTPRRFDQHASTRFPLTGAHAMLDCRSCHRAQARDQYRGTPTTCDACHRKQSLNISSFQHKYVRPGCSSCHSTFAWAPARFDHAMFWPLVGAHAAVKGDCAKCHDGSNFSAATSACSSCHGSLVDSGKTQPDHKALGFSRTCSNCHTPVSWQALRSGWHDAAFPISNGDHARYRNSCTSCHPGGVGKGNFDCVNCHDGEHSKAKMDKKHDMTGYAWDNKACLGCHPDGNE
jgi:hypothetical protein